MIGSRFRRPSKPATGGRRAWVLLFVLAQSWITSPAPASGEELIVGIFPRRNPSEVMEMFGPLAGHLSRELGRPVKLETTPDFPSFWEAIAARRYHVVHFNQYHYVRAHKEFGYRVVAKNEEGGRDAIAAVILVRKDSGHKTVQDLRGKKIVFGGNEQAMGAYILPRYLLQQAGLGIKDYQSDFALNPPNVALAVFFRKTDAGGTGDIVFDMPFVKDKVDVSQMMYIAKSEPIAHLPWAVRGDISTAERERIQKALVNVKSTPNADQILKPASLTNLVSAHDREYRRTREIIRAVTGERY